MADVQALHAGDGAIDEGFGGDAGERARGDLADRHFQRLCAMGRDAAHHVAFGDDAVGGQRSIGRAVSRHEDRADAAFGHDVDRVFRRGAFRDRHDRTGHQVVDAVAVGIGVDRAGGRGQIGAGNRFNPAGTVAAFEPGGQRQASAFRLGECAHVAVCQVGQQRHEDFRGGARVALGAVAARNRNAEPACQGIE